MPHIPLAKAAGVLAALAAAAVVQAAVAPAQAQDAAGPLVLLLPSSATLASQGNAGVAARDDYALFYNPANAAAVPGIGLSTSFYARDSRSVAFVAGATVGSLTFGWGAQLVDFSVPRASVEYPFTTATLTYAGDADNTSVMAALGAQRAWKGFRIGLSAKYAEDILPRETVANGLLVVPSRGAAFLADFGLAHALWSGNAGLAIQNIGHPYRLGPDRFAVPTQAALGWAATRQWGPLDITCNTQLLARRGGWISPAGGVQVGWSWIEGYSIAGHLGGRRAETRAERPVEFGASFTADRLSFDYGVTLFEGNTAAHFISLRWK